MGDYFYVGKLFSSFDEIKAVLAQAKKEQKIDFRINKCVLLTSNEIIRSKSYSSQAAVANKALRYFRLRLDCFRGGRKHISTARFRKRRSLRQGCPCYVYLTLSQCGQYLEVRRLCLDHNHELELKPPMRKEMRAEKRRQNLMKRMNISYEEAVVLERKNISAKNRLVGPVETEEENSSESSDQFKYSFTSNFDANQTVFSTNKNIDEVTRKKRQSEDEDSNSSMDLNDFSNRSFGEDNDISLKQSTSSATKAQKRKYPSESSDKGNEDEISDDEDYRKPLNVPTKKQAKKYYSVMEKSHFTNDNDEDFDDNEVNRLESSYLSEEENDDPTLKPNIFTRKGDDGMASTFSGMRLYKNDIVFKALGTIEELSSSIGHAKEFLPKFCTIISEQLVEIQCVLQDMVIHVGTPQNNCSEFHRVNSLFPENYVIRLENLIHEHEEKLPKVNEVVLPSGGLASTSLHMARSICRRAERKVVQLVREGDANRTVLCYLNRLGDYLFVAARIVCLLSTVEECVYTKPNFNVNPNLSSVAVIKPAVPGYASANQGYSIIYLPPTAPNPIQYLSTNQKSNPLFKC